MGNARELEKLRKANNSRELHKQVKEMTGCKKSHQGTGCIKSRDGNILFEQEEIQKRWVEYIDELYDDNRGQQQSVYGRLGEGREILQEVVKHAIRQMKSGKAAGIDEITTEMLQALDSYEIGKITELCKVIYKTGNIPQELMNSIFIALPKKPKAMDCSQYRTISLRSHVMKVLLKIILNRNRNKMEAEIHRVDFDQRLELMEGFLIYELSWKNTWNAIEMFSFALLTSKKPSIKSNKKDDRVIKQHWNGWRKS